MMCRLGMIVRGMSRMGRMICDGMVDLGWRGGAGVLGWVFYWVGEWEWKMVSCES